MAVRQYQNRRVETIIERNICRQFQKMGGGKLKVQHINSEMKNGSTNQKI